MGKFTTNLDEYIEKYCIAQENINQVKRAIRKIYLYQKNNAVSVSEPNVKFTDFEHGNSAFDPLGRILYKNGKVYRGIYKKSKDYFISLYKTGILQILAEEKLIPEFSLTNYYTDEFPLIIEIEKVRMFTSFSWTFSMIKEEAKLKIKLINILKEFGYGLIDGHAGNATFKDGKAIFIDFGSFIKDTSNSCAKEQIIIYNIFPLIWLSLKEYLISRQVYFGRIFPRVIPYPDFFKSIEATTALKKFKKPHNSALIEKIKKREIPTCQEIDACFPQEKYLRDTAWSNYSINKNNEIEISNSFYKIIDKIKTFSKDANSFLDIAGNSGCFASLIAQTFNFESIISVDNDEMALEKGIKSFHDKKITFALLNPILPPAGIEKELKSDIVCALAISHHLLLSQYYNIDHIFKQLKKYVNKLNFVR